MCVSVGVALGEREGGREALQRRRRHPDSFPAHSAPRLPRLPQRSASSVSRRRRRRRRRYSDRRRDPGWQPSRPPVAGCRSESRLRLQAPSLRLRMRLSSSHPPQPGRGPGRLFLLRMRPRLPGPVFPCLVGRASASGPGRPVANRNWDPAAADLRRRYCNPRRPETGIGPLVRKGRRGPRRQRSGSDPRRRGAPFGPRREARGPARRLGAPRPTLAEGR